MEKHLSITKMLLLLICLAVLCTSCEMPSLSHSDNDEAKPENPAEVFLTQTPSESGLLLTPAADIRCDLFVAPDGDDSHTGTEAAPWASFQHAAVQAAPGDTVCFRAGRYVTEDIHLSKSGDMDAFITFAAYPGEQPLLDGDGSANELLVLQRGVSYLRISGFKLINFRIWGVFLSGDNHDIHLDHLEIAGGETSIRFTYGESSESPPAEGLVENVVLEDSLIHESQYSAVDCTPGPCNYFTIRRLEVFNTGLGGEAFFGSDGIEFARGHHILVEDCFVHDNGGDGIDLGSRDREGNMEGIFVRRNQVVRNHLNGIKLWSGGRIENNSIWGQGNSAIWAGTFDSTVEIINNTVAYNMWDPQFAARNWAVVVGYPEEVPKPEVDLIMVNNIFAFNATPLEGGPTSVYLGPGVQIVREGSNLYFSREEEEIMVDVDEGLSFSQKEILSGVWKTFSKQGEGNLCAAPLFLSGFPEVDLRLQADSPAINAGRADLAPEMDIFCATRDEQPDIGAYEY